MKTDVHFKDMVRSEALENFAATHVDAIVSEFLNRHDYHTQIWLKTEHGHNERGVPMFCCEIDIRYPPKKEVFIQKFHNDMYQAVRMAVDSLKVTLREISKRELDSRQQNIGRVEYTQI